MAWSSVALLGVMCCFGASASDYQKKSRDQLTRVASYEVTIPQLVDEDGVFLSYKVAQDSFNSQGRHKRSTRKTAPMFYKIRIGGKDIQLALILSPYLVTKNYAFEIWDSHGITTPKPSGLCHYHGYVIGHPSSTIAVSNCLGLHGALRFKTVTYFIEPLWNRTNPSGSQHPHIVYKRSAIANNSCLHIDANFKVITSAPFDVPFQILTTLSSQFKKFSRVKRSFSHENFVETLVVADRATVAFHGPSEAEIYVLTIMNIVSHLFRDPSIGNAIHIVVTRLILLTEDQPHLEISHHAGQTLASFCRWQNNITLRSRTVPKRGLSRHDTAILITRYDICYDKEEACETLGLAQVKGMCKPERSCSINQDIGLISGFTIAHELGHNFGMQHDGVGNHCGPNQGSNKGHIMTRHLSQLLHPVSWSACSKEYITDFLDSGLGHCLKNVPPFKEQAFTFHLMGEQFGMEEQCKSQYGSWSTRCRSKGKETCETLWCRSRNRRCVTNNVPVLDGTPCNTSKWCLNGECIVRGSKPISVDGHWGNWSEWSKCSRTCGGGVETSIRLCNNPRPRNGGSYCIGERKRYRSCNFQVCPSGGQDFRALQCKAHNNQTFQGRVYEWIPYIRGQVKPCALFCKAVGFNFFAEKAVKVVDGTRCFPNRLGICVNGLCRIYPSQAKKPGPFFYESSRKVKGSYP